MPLGSSGMMTTNYLRASNLTLIAAFSSAQSPPFERCGQGCAEQSSASRLVTCGHMYLDHGGPLAERSWHSLRFEIAFCQHAVHAQDISE